MGKQDNVLEQDRRFVAYANDLRHGLQYALDHEEFDNDGAVIGFRRSDGLEDVQLAIVYYHLRMNGVADEDIPDDNKPRWAGENAAAGGQD